MNPKHFADDLPWTAEPGGYGLHDAQGNVPGMAIEPETAQRIAKCVNAHDLLMEALLEIKATAEHRMAHGRYPVASGASANEDFEAWASGLVDATLDSIIALYAPRPLPALAEPVECTCA